MLVDNQTLIKRDKRGRFIKTYRESSWVDKVLILIIICTAIGMIVSNEIKEATKPVVYVAEAKEEVKKEVLIEVKINWTKERIEKEIRTIFPNSPNTAVAVAKSESGPELKPDAYNPEWHYDKYGNKLCQGSYGVFQIACVHHMENPEALFDVDFNIQKATEIHSKSGWYPWGGYTSGGWKKYI